MALLLDLEAPFVRAVFAVLGDGADHDRAIEVLIAAERRHGIRILREEVVGSMASTFVPIDPKPTLRQFRELMARYPLQAVRDDRGPTPPPEYQDWQRRFQQRFRVGSDEDTPNQPLNAFLTETSFLLGGTDFANDHWIEFPNGALASWTQRAWGAQLAAWRGNDDYATFTFYLYQYIDRYEEWCSTALEVIRRKCERQLDEPPAHT